MITIKFIPRFFFFYILTLSIVNQNPLSDGTHPLFTKNRIYIYIYKKEGNSARTPNFSACKTFVCSNLDRVSEYTKGYGIPAWWKTLLLCKIHEAHDVSGQSAAARSNYF